MMTNDPQLGPAQFGTPCLVSFTTDGSKQKFDVSIECEDPTGQKHSLLFRSIQASPGIGGGAILAETLVLPISQSGKYWLNLFIDGTQISRRPLDITYSYSPNVKP
jgi:hypothetical protein